MVQACADAGVRRSMGATGNSYDNSLAETINGLHKTELIKAQGPWRTVDQVEVATLEWVDWFTTADSVSTAGTCHPPSARRCTTVTTELSTAEFSTP
ncbi:integrase core domain-containing protein [Mycolicibacterium goodii]|nr:integrase core domain-containing protein [Mycolicibacterium goodii]